MYYIITDYLIWFVILIWIVIGIKNAKSFEFSKLYSNKAGVVTNLDWKFNLVIVAEVSEIVRNNITDDWEMFEFTEVFSKLISSFAWTQATRVTS